MHGHASTCSCWRRQHQREQRREDEQEWKTREQKKKAKDAKRIRGIVHENDKWKGTSHVQDERVKLMHHDEQELLDHELCATARREEVEYIRRHRMYTRVPLRNVPARNGERTRDSKRSPMCAPGGLRRTTKHMQDQNCTPQLEALKVVLSEAATGKREGKVVALVDVRRAYFHSPSRRRVFVELPPEGYQAVEEHMCGLLQCSLFGTRHAQNCEEDLASALSDLKFYERNRVPTCVARLYQR